MAKRCGKMMCCNNDCLDCYPLGYVDTDNVKTGGNVTMINREYYNSLLEAVHYKQMIEESCNGDHHENHFRETLTVADCVVSFEAAKMWTRYAMDYCLCND